MSDDSIFDEEIAYLRDTIKTLKGIHVLDPTFSLSGYLKQLEEKEKQKDRLKNTLAWKLRESAGNFYVRALTDKTLYFEFYTNSDLEEEKRIEAILNKNSATYTHFCGFLKANMNIEMARSFIKDLYDIDHILGHKNRDHTSYHTPILPK